MIVSACAAAVGALAALGFSFWISGVPGEDVSAGTSEAALALRLDALRRDLQEEREARGRLEAQVSLLERTLREGPALPADSATLAQGDRHSPSPSTDGEAPTPRKRENASGASKPAASPTSPAWPQRPWFDAEAAADAGLGRREAARLQHRWEEAELEKLYLRDQAARGERGQLHQRLKDVNAGLREELGEEGYDWLLFATGQGNQVVVGDVLARSPADEAGFRADDRVVRYDGTRIYTTQELQRATATGNVGERVYVDVVRDDQPLTIVVPRGPLGVRLQQERQAP